jgi:hypothetical protein
MPIASSDQNLIKHQRNKGLGEKWPKNFRAINSTPAIHIPTPVIPSQTSPNTSKKISKVFRFRGLAQWDIIDIDEGGGMPRFALRVLADPNAHQAHARAFVA